MRWRDTIRCVRDYAREQWDVPRRKTGSLWGGYLAFGAIYVYALVSPTTRRALSGQDGQVLQIASIVAIGAALGMLTIRAVRALDARRNPKV